MDRGTNLDSQEELPEAEEGSFYSYDLEGCTVYQEGEAIGIVVEVVDHGGTTILGLDRDGEEILIPFAQSFLKKIDTKAKRIDVELPEGLVEVNRKLKATKEEKAVNTKRSKLKSVAESDPIV